MNQVSSIAALVDRLLVVAGAAPSDSPSDRQHHEGTVRIMNRVCRRDGARLAQPRCVVTMVARCPQLIGVAIPWSNPDSWERAFVALERREPEHVEALALDGRDVVVEAGRRVAWPPAGKLDRA